VAVANCPEASRNFSRREAFVSFYVFAGEIYVALSVFVRLGGKKERRK
jgi:hypothetical protein